MAVVRGLLVVSEWAGGRVQVLTLEGVPLQAIIHLHARSTPGVGPPAHPPLTRLVCFQVLPLLGSALAGLCISGERVWVTDGVNHKVRVLEAV